VPTVAAAADRDSLAPATHAREGDNECERNESGEVQAAATAVVRRNPSAANARESTVMPYIRRSKSIQRLQVV
jgi:hypothetical protein